MIEHRPREANSIVFQGNYWTNRLSSLTSGPEFLGYRVIEAKSAPKEAGIGGPEDIWTSSIILVKDLSGAAQPAVKVAFKYEEHNPGYDAVLFNSLNYVKS